MRVCKCAVHTHTCVLLHRDQIRTLNILLHNPLSLFLETGFLTEPWPRLVVRNLHGSSCFWLFLPTAMGLQMHFIHLDFDMDVEYLNSGFYGYIASVLLNTSHPPRRYSFLLFNSLFILYPEFSFPYGAMPPQRQSSSLFLFRKRQATHGYQQSMAYQVSLRLSTVSCI